MFVEERQALILEQLHKNGKVRVKDLSEQFGVTPDLIRKDLTTMEKKGLLKKAYGGAVLERININRKNASQRKDLNTKDKQEIVKLASQIIKEDQVVFLDVSTSSIELALLLQKQERRIIVVTNMIEVMLILAKSETIKLIFIGGELDFGRDGFVGSTANEEISNYRFDVAFLGVVGIDVFSGSVYTYMNDDGLTKKAVLASSQKAYMLCELDKFNQLGNYRYAGISDFTGIVTSGKPSKEIQKCLIDANLEVIYP
ncbi:DeoR family transcriptional regulator [Erysipelotrichaceae bacterium MTC7]|nr:DeoR family transcriptional regulator [Erysipelotrichaceae bacterium MTC7]